MTMSLRNVILFLSLLLGLAACGQQEHHTSFNAYDITEKYPHADFHLTDGAGKTVSLADFHDKVVVLFFGYTHCPQICPTTLSELARMMRNFGSDADKVQVLLITLDPERDTNELLAKYTSAFYPTFKGLSGDSKAIAQIAASFGVTYKKNPNKNGGYEVDHSAGTFLIGQNGKPVLLAPFWQRADLWEQDIRSLLVSK